MPGSHVAAWALKSQLVRRAVWNVLDRKAGASSRTGDASRTDRINADQRQMIRNVCRFVERWITEGRASTHSVSRFLQSFPVNGASRAAAVASKKFERAFARQPPRFVTISPTKKCNLACTGCYASSRSTEHESLPYEVVDRIVREQASLWGSRFTVISGGEPFMYDSDGRGILDLVAAHPRTFFLVYTNGTLITKEVAGRIAELGNLTPAISVEGFEADTDTRRGKGVHAQTMKAMENLRRAGALFGVSVTATRRNADVVLSPDFVHSIFREAGAYYLWLFQYMPIGRGQSLDLMVTVEQRIALLELTRSWMYKEGLMIADFWNSATISNGCLSAGRSGGYIYIDWNGNVLPCVFNPYTLDNIMAIYRRGGDLNTALESPLMRNIRDWQGRYHSESQADGQGNLFAPCPIRDHHHELRAILDRTSARPADQAAKAALNDESYYRGLSRYGEELELATRPLWERYLGARWQHRAAEASPSSPDP